MQTEHKYQYQHGWYIILAGILFCGPAIPFLFYTAFSARTRLNINGLIRLDTIPSSILLGIGGVLFSFMFYTSIKSLYSRFKNKTYLVVNPNELIVPGGEDLFGNTKPPRVISINEIISVQEIQLNWRQFLFVIQTKDLKKCSISSVKFKKNTEYEEVKSIIMKRLKF